MQQSGQHLKARHLIARSRHPTQADVAAFIRANGGRLTNKLPSPSQPAWRHRFRYRCARGHIAENSVADFRRKRWCKGCTWNRLTHEECAAYATKHAGTLLTGFRETIRDTDYLRFACRRKHRFVLSGTNVKAERWCRECGRLARRVNADRFAAKAKSRGGAFLGRGEEKHCRELRFRCSAEHAFAITVSNFNKGTWCPTCSSGLGERLVREVLETLLGIPFPRVRPAWLEMRPGSYLELDGYNSNAQIAFEHHGRQHFGAVAMRFPTDFRSQKKRDCFKKNQCAAQGVRLIEIPEVFGITPVEKLKAAVVAECRRLGIRIPRARLGLKPDLDKAYRTEAFDSLLSRVGDLVKRKGGRLLSLTKKATGTFSRIPAVVRCRRKHRWSTTLGQILGGHWCKACYLLDRDSFLDGRLSPKDYESLYGIAEPRGIRTRLEDVRALTNELGLTLESTHYRSAKTPCKVRCRPCGEVFSITYDNLKQGRPTSCPSCSRAKAGLRRRHSIEKLQKAAARKKGWLLSWVYRGVFEPMRWWCSTCEDSFVREVDPILRGKWCQRCSRHTAAGKRSATLRAKAMARRVKEIEAGIAAKHWRITCDLRQCIAENRLVSITCSHGVTFQRHFKYLLRGRLRCDCERSNSTVRSLSRLRKTLEALKWTLVSKFVDSKTTVMVQCEHGKHFERIAGMITRDSKCECAKRSATGQKYISKRPSGRFQVNIPIDYRWHCLGSFTNLAKAIRARNAFCKKRRKTL